MTLNPLRLKVQRIGQVCLFELSWGQGQCLNATLPYPVRLIQLYQEWRRCYLNFYRTTSITVLPDLSSGPGNEFRGWAMASGSSAADTADWHNLLVEAEIRLLNEFHHWLRSAELFEIRATIARTSQQDANTQHHTNVFLTCSSDELNPLPWQAWEIGADFAGTGAIWVIRTPFNLRAANSRPHRQSRRRARILAILGDDTGLNFAADQSAVRSLSRIAEVRFVGWQPGQTAVEVKEQIRRSLLDESGWDVLFFAGHSNETQVTGGELSVAPGVAMSICELTTTLTTARDNGLQFAVFNSCNGLAIAQSLIDLGFSQVAVMREPIHNRVAAEFLVQFIRNLAAHKDVQEALSDTCQFLRAEKGLTYPSAYLIPCLYGHPNAQFFRIPFRGWKEQLRQLVPLRAEAIALVTCIVVGLLSPVQGFLLDQRVGMQAVYRQMTGQVPAPTRPTVLLVQVDDRSARQDPRVTSAEADGIGSEYLADLIQRLSKLNPPIIGVDYLLDRKHSEVLRQSIRTVVEQQNTIFVFVDNQIDRSDFVAQGIAQPEWSMQGHGLYWYMLHPSHVSLPLFDEDCYRVCPFAYLLALVYQANQDLPNRLPQPQINGSGDFRTRFLDTLDQELNTLDRGPANQAPLQLLRHLQLHPLSTWVETHWEWVWLQPIIDFSIPPDQVYERIASWRVLEDPSLQLPHLTQQIALIGAGDYDDPDRLVNGQLDYYPLPAAIRYWQRSRPSDNSAATFPAGRSENNPAYLMGFTGAEAHAYMIHHLLNRHLIVPIPHLWMMGLAGLMGRSLVLVTRYRQRQYGWTRKQRLRYWGGLCGLTLAYGLAGLQLYITANLLLPFLLPSLVMWSYLLPVLRRKPDV